MHTVLPKAAFEAGKGRNITDITEYYGILRKFLLRNITEYYGPEYHPPPVGTPAFGRGLRPDP